MRYAAQPLGVLKRGLWRVTEYHAADNTYSTITNDLTEAQAFVFEFALNALARSLTLTAYEPFSEASVLGTDEERYGTFVDYEGPTEGITP